MSITDPKQFTTEISDDVISSLLAEIEQTEVKPDGFDFPRFDSGIVVPRGYSCPLPPDLSRYRFSAHLDTILIEIETEQACKPDSLRTATGCYCRSLEQNLIDAGFGSRFWYVKIQDPTIDSIQACLDAVSSRWGLVSVPVITWLDVSLDARLRGLDKRRNKQAGSLNTVDQYSDLLVAWRDCLKPDSLRGWNDDLCRWRYSRERRKLANAGDFPENGATAYVGEKRASDDAPISNSFFRAYFRVKDRTEMLDPIDRTARLECRIGRLDLERLKLKSVDDLEGFDWRKLASLFNFADARQFAGLPVAECRSFIVQHSISVRADARLNDVAQRALSRLKL